MEVQIPQEEVAIIGDVWPIKMHHKFTHAAKMNNSISATGEAKCIPPDWPVSY